MSDLSEYPVVHVYAQGFEHDDAAIVCNPAGIALLREALRTGSAQVMAADGEWYTLRVVVADEPEKLPTQYADVSDTSGLAENALDAAEARESATRNALQFACDQLAELLDDACPHGTCPAVEDQDPAQCDLSQKASCVMGACEAAVTLADGGVPDPSCCMSVVGIITARAAQSAAQVRVLAGELCRTSCVEADMTCPAGVGERDCDHCPYAAQDLDQWAAWSAREAGVSHE